MKIGMFYLADSGYAATEMFITPYRENTYHLPEYRDRRQGLQSPIEVFNYTHSSLRNCVERTFGVWKKRFKILRNMPPYSIQKQVKIVVACGILHNFIIMVRQDDPLIRSYDQDGMPVAVIRRANDGPLSDDETDDNADDDGDENFPDGPLLERGQETATRDGMAASMWQRFIRSPWYRT